jgi:hypothetical protein
MPRLKSTCHYKGCNEYDRFIKEVKVTSVLSLSYDMFISGNNQLYHLPFLFRFLGSLQSLTIFNISSLSRSSNPPLANTSA